MLSLQLVVACKSQTVYRTQL